MIVRSCFLHVLAVSLAIVLAPLTVATAVDIGGVPVPDTYQADGRTLVLNGAALRTIPILQIRTYITALYLPRKMQSAEAILTAPGPKVAVVHYLHSGSREQVQERYRTGERNNCSDGRCDAALETDFNRLVNDVTPVEPGDKTVFLVDERGLLVSFNGRPFVAYGKTELGNLIVNGFIGPHAPTPEFRAALLGRPGS